MPPAGQREPAPSASATVVVQESSTQAAAALIEREVEEAEIIGLEADLGAVLVDDERGEILAGFDIAESDRFALRAVL